MARVGAGVKYALKLDLTWKQPQVERRTRPLHNGDMCPARFEERLLRSFCFADSPLIVD
jgi:hypothetical protein